MTTLNEKKTMVQSNNMIDNRENWGMMENRLYYSIVKRIDPTAESILQIEIPLAEIIKEWELTPSSAYDRICTAATNLATQNYTIKEFDKNGRASTLDTRPFFARITAKKGTGKVVVKLNSELESEFIQLKNNFTKTDFGMLALLTKGTSQRLYDLLMEYKGLGKRVFHARELERRIRPHADKVAPYDQPKKITEKLVEPAVTEINEKTNLYIEYQKFGRGEDTHYEFTISEKDKKPSKKATGKKESEKIAEVVEHLNKVTGHRYRPDSDHKELRARLKEYTVEDCKRVIDSKYKRWENWAERDNYMNTKTLFSKSNFTRYYEEMKAMAEPHKPTGLPTDIPGVDDDGYINLDLAREAVAQGRRWYKDPSGMIVNF